MTEDYGKKVGRALAAVVQLHEDTSRLLTDIERFMSGRESIFGNQATTDMSKHVKPSTGFWMAEGVYRFFVDPRTPNQAFGICVVFIAPDIEEPLLLLSRLVYQAPAVNKGACMPWDVWELFF